MSEAVLEVLESVADMVANPEVADEPEKTWGQTVQEKADRLEELVATSKCLLKQLAHPEMIRVGYGYQWDESLAASIFADGCRVELNRLMDEIDAITSEIADLL